MARETSRADLEDGDWKSNRLWKELFLDYMANPMDVRTEVEFCKENAISRVTLWRWKKANHEEVFKEVQRRRKIYTAELRAVASKALVKKLGTDTNAIKLAFQLMGDLVEKTESRVEHMSHEDKVRRINDLLSKIEAKKAKWGSEPSKGDSDGEVQLGGIEPGGTGESSDGLQP